MIKYYFIGKETNKEINPDETIAYSPTFHGGILGGEYNGQTGDLILMDVTLLALNIETVGGVMIKIIPKKL